MAEAASLGACSSCGSSVDSAQAAVLLRKEAAFVERYRSLEQNFADMPDPQVTLPRVLADAQKVLAEEHWTVNGLLDMNQDLFEQFGNIERAIQMIEARQRAWTHLMPRPSVQAGFLHEKRADMLLRRGRRADAAAGYLASLNAFRAVIRLGDPDGWYADVAGKFRSCLEGA